MRKFIIMFLMIILVMTSAYGSSKKPIKAVNNKAISGIQTFVTDSIGMYPTILSISGSLYGNWSYQVITDKKILSKEIGTVKFDISLYDTITIDTSKETYARFITEGSKIYSIKNIDKEVAVAVEDKGKLTLYRSEAGYKKIKAPTGNGITKDCYKATALIVENQDDNKQIKIVDKAKIKKVLDGIKSGVSTKEEINYPDGNGYTFYFIIPDKNGIGQIVYEYLLNFQDINLNGYVTRFSDTYKVDSTVSKIITETFGSQVYTYDNDLGGKQQIYDMMAEVKFILRKVVKETPTEKFTVKVLKQGEEIWQGGNKVKDSLPGKFKIEIFMEDTKLQDNILNMITLMQYKGLLAVNASTADAGNSSVLYLSYDEEPKLNFEESADSFVLFPSN